MNLYQLQYFRTMAKMEHYTKASNMLCITQPSLSNAIASLEDELGVALFEKRGRNVVLNRYGKVFLSYVENALNEIKSGCDKIKELSGEFSMPIRVGFIYTLSNCFIPNLIAGFKKTDDNGNIELSLVEGTTHNACTPGLVKDLKNDKLDLIFISLLPKDPDIEFTKICAQDLVVLVADTSPFAKMSSVDLRDLERVPFIHFSGKSGLKYEINGMFEKAGMVPNISCEVEDYISVVELVASGVGFAVVPKSPVLYNFNVKMLPIKHPKYARDIYIGHMKNRALPPAAERFMNYAAQHSAGIMDSGAKAAPRKTKIDRSPLETEVCAPNNY